MLDPQDMTSFSAELVAKVSRRLRDDEGKPATPTQTKHFIKYAVDETEGLTLDMCVQASYAQRVFDIIDQSELAGLEAFPTKLWKTFGNRVWHDADLALEEQEDLAADKRTSSQIAAAELLIKYGFEGQGPTVGLMLETMERVGPLPTGSDAAAWGSYVANILQAARPGDAASESPFPMSFDPTKVPLDGETWANVVDNLPAGTTQICPDLAPVGAVNPTPPPTPAALGPDGVTPPPPAATALDAGALAAINQINQKINILSTGWTARLDEITAGAADREADRDRKQRDEITLAVRAAMMDMRAAEATAPEALRDQRPRETPYRATSGADAARPFSFGGAGGGGGPADPGIDLNVLNSLVVETKGPAGVSISPAHPLRQIFILTGVQYDDYMKATGPLTVKSTKFGDLTAGVVGTFNHVSIGSLGASVVTVTNPKEGVAKFTDPNAVIRYLEFVRQDANLASRVVREGKLDPAALRARSALTTMLTKIPDSLTQLWAIEETMSANLVDFYFNLLGGYDGLGNQNLLVDEFLQVIELVILDATAHYNTPLEKVSVMFYMLDQMVVNGQFDYGARCLQVPRGPGQAKYVKLFERMGSAHTMNLSYDVAGCMGSSTILLGTTGQITTGASPGAAAALTLVTPSGTTSNSAWRQAAKANSVANPAAVAAIRKKFTGWLPYAGEHHDGTGRSATKLGDVGDMSCLCCGAKAATAAPTNRPSNVASLGGGHKPKCCGARNAWLDEHAFTGSSKDEGIDVLSLRVGWHNRELIHECYKAGLFIDELSDFLPGGKFSSFQ